MLPILKLANLYSEKKLQRKYPCISEDGVLIENLFFEFIKHIRFIDRYYDTLQDSYYEANEIIFEWQKSDSVPTSENPYRNLLDEELKLEENIYWKEDCGAETAVEILRDVQPLWSALLAHKIDNEGLDENQFSIFMDDMAAFMDSRDKVTMTYPYTLKRQSSPPRAQSIPNPNPDVETTEASGLESTLEESQTLSEDERKSGRTKIWIAILIGAGLIYAGYYFFSSGAYQQYTENLKRSARKVDNFENILVDSSYDSKLVLYSTLNDSEVVILWNERPYLDKIYDYDSFQVGNIDSLDKLRGVLSLNKLDPSLYYQVHMTGEQYEEFKSMYPDLVFLLKPETQNDKPIIIKLKKTQP